jgi:putative ABC transport system permease protein
VRGLRLAIYNLAHQPLRFLLTIAGITCATLLMLIQGNLLMSFLGAASKIIDSTDADLWVAGRGTPCFEFPANLEARVADLARGVDGVEDTTSISARIASFKKPDGSEQLVTLIGTDAAGPKFPVPRLPGGSGAIQPEAVLIDSSTAGQLNVRGLVPAAVEINGQRADVVGEISGFSSFLGTPYVFTSYNNALHYLNARRQETAFVLVRVRTGTSAEVVKRRLQERFPNVDVWTRSEFARRAQIYWSSQTGAGSAILLAALLGFLIGVAVVSQSVYATTMEHLEEYATLRALGANSGFLIGVILWQAMATGVAGYALGAGVSGTVLDRIKAAIPWLASQGSLLAATLPLTLAICGIASVLSIRAALATEPGRVFRV